LVVNPLGETKSQGTGCHFDRCAGARQRFGESGQRHNALAVQPSREIRGFAAFPMYTWTVGVQHAGGELMYEAGYLTKTGKHAEVLVKADGAETKE